MKQSAFDFFTQLGAECVAGVMYYKRKAVGSFGSDGFTLSDEGNALFDKLQKDGPEPETEMPADVEPVAAKPAKGKPGKAPKSEPEPAQTVDQLSASIDDLLGAPD